MNHQESILYGRCGISCQKRGRVVTDRRNKKWSQRDEAERLQFELCARLNLLAKTTNRHSSYRCARKLLSDAYRQKTISKRLAVLKAAFLVTSVAEEMTWAIDRFTLGGTSSNDGCNHAGNPRKTMRPMSTYKWSRRRARRPPPTISLASKPKG
jgi:hypothetical protein